MFWIQSPGLFWIRNPKDHFTGERIIAVHSLSSNSYAWRPYDFAWNFYISPASRVFGIYNNRFPAKIFIFATELLQQRLSCILSFIDNLQRDFCRQIMYQIRLILDESSLVDLNRVWREIFAKPWYVLYMIS